MAKPRNSSKSAINSSPSNLTTIKYRKSFLREVIVRLDLLRPIPNLEQKLPRTIMKIAKQHFPITDPKSIKMQDVQLAPDQTYMVNASETMEWHFHGREREKTLKILPNTLIISYSRYSSFQDLEEEFSQIFHALSTEFPDIQPVRLGLRYINNIVLSEDKPLNWEKYIHQPLLSGFHIFPEPSHLSRLFNILEFNFGDFNLKFQFGMPNPDYPALIRQKIFVLDFDAHTQGLVDISEVMTNLKIYHSKIQDIFEFSITSALRDLMNTGR